MKILSLDLIADLIQRTKDNLNQVIAFQELKLVALNKKVNPKSWSALECIEHLNRYGDFYLPEIEQRMRKAKKSNPKTSFKSGLLGNYFAKAMLPKEKLNKMKTFKSMNPLDSHLDKTVLTKFIDQQRKMLELLQFAKEIDLTKTKTSISISKLIKLRLGDSFRVVIYHNQRHLLQASLAMNDL